jgi:hypothetical protein
MADEVGAEVPITVETVDDTTREFLKTQSNKILSKFAQGSVISSTILSIAWSAVNLIPPGFETSVQAGIAVGVGGSMLVALKDVYDLRNVGKSKEK